MKRWGITLLLTLAMILSSTTALAHEHGIQVHFNGRMIHFDSPPVIENGRTLVPFRAIFEAMGAEVGYDAATQKVTGTRGTTKIEMTIGSSTAFVNGRSTTLEVAPKIISRRTMVPVRFISEAMGVKVSWNEAQRRIDLDDAKWPNRGGVVTAGMISAPAGTFHPHISSNVYDSYINAAVYDGLWSADDSLTPRPNLASHWTVSDDGTAITFYLKPGIKWHDGQPLTIEDVHFSFMAFMHKDYKGPRSTGWDMLVGYDDYRAGRSNTVSGLKIVPNNGIQFQLKEVYSPFFLRNTGHAVVPKHLYEKVPVADWGTAKDPHMAKPIGTGPFKFNQYRTGQFIVLDRNPDYHNGAPYIDRLIWRVIASELAVAELEVGRIDYAEAIPAKDLATAQKNQRINVHAYPGLTFQYMGMNTQRAPLNDVRVRQAVAYAVDRQAIIDGVIDGQGGLMHSALHPLTWAYSDVEQKYLFNQAKSRELLDAAGWKVGSDGYRYKDGKKLTMSLLYPTGNIARENTAPVVQAMLKEVGIEVVLDRADFATLLTKSNMPQYDYDLLFLGFRLGIEPDPADIHGKQAIKEGGFNRQQWWTPKSEELLKKATQTMDIEERKAIYAEWLNHFQEEIPVVHLYASNMIQGVHKRIGNFVTHPTDSTWNIADWYIIPGQ